MRRLFPSKIRYFLAARKTAMTRKQLIKSEVLRMEKFQKKRDTTLMFFRVIGPEGQICEGAVKMSRMSTKLRVGRCIIMKNIFPIFKTICADRD